MKSLGRYIFISLKDLSSTIFVLASPRDRFFLLRTSKSAFESRKKLTTSDHGNSLAISLIPTFHAKIYNRCARAFRKTVYVFPGNKWRDPRNRRMCGRSSRKTKRYKENQLTVDGSEQAKQLEVYLIRPNVCQISWLRVATISAVSFVQYRRWVRRLWLHDLIYPEGLAFYVCAPWIVEIRLVSIVKYFSTEKPGDTTRVYDTWSIYLAK